MIKVKLGWEWMRFHFFCNKFNQAIVANIEFRPIGFELYRGSHSVMIYLELVIGTLMIKLDK
jgi:hypothetical protein